MFDGVIQRGFDQTFQSFFLFYYTSPSTNESGFQ